MSDRRSFLHASLFGAAGLGLRGISGRSGAERDDAPTEPWLEGLTGVHRQFFDVQSMQGGAPLKRVGNFLDAYAKSYGVAQSKINVVFGAHVNAVAIALNDASWVRYSLGRHYNVVEPGTTGVVTINPFRAPGGSSSFLPPHDSIEELLARGVRFLACNNSLQNLANELTRTGGPSAAAIHDELVASVLPGVVVVPAMVVAINRAQESGLTYCCIP